MKMVMDCGESRHVRIRIVNIKDEPFRILSAEYEFLKDNEAIFQGKPEIIDHVLDVLLTPPEKGEYTLKYTYTIGDETLIDKIGIQVI